MVYESSFIHENEVVILSCIQKGPTAHGLVPQFIVLRYTNLKEMYRLKVSDSQKLDRSILSEVWRKLYQVQWLYSCRIYVSETNPEMDLFVEN